MVAGRASRHAHVKGGGKGMKRRRGHAAKEMCRAGGCTSEVAGAKRRGGPSFFAARRGQRALNRRPPTAVIRTPAVPASVSRHIRSLSGGCPLACT